MRTQDGFLKYLLTGRRKLYALLLFIIFGLTFYILPFKDLFLTSMVMLQKSEPFTGTVMPVQKVPDWQKLGINVQERKTLEYSQMDQGDFIDIPEYDPQMLNAKFASLGQNNQDKKVANAKITYTVLYMGSYSELWTENAGSHAAVDIIAPTGTPVYAAANAVVHKAYAGKYGEGNTVILRHDDVPSKENPDYAATYYSAYEHLDGFTVQKGDKVQKGDLIGYVGNTGNSSTPHLHFQIDKDNAPYHPYYTSDKEKAAKHTIHPVEWVQQHMDFEGTFAGGTLAQNDQTQSTDSSQSTDDTSDTQTSFGEQSSDDTTDEVSEDAINDESENIDSTTQDTKTGSDTQSTDIKDSESEIVADAYTFNLQDADLDDLYEKEQITIQIDAVDKDGETDPNYNATAKLDTSSSFGTFEEGERVQFENGMAYIHYTQSLSDHATITVQDDTNNIEISKELAFKSNKDQDLFTDLTAAHKNYKAIKYLKENDIINGYEDGSFQPARTVSRAELIKIILLGTDKGIEENLENAFADVPNTAWFKNYVLTAKQEGIVEGYDDGTFKPSQTVSRAEALKIVLETVGTDIPNEVSEDPYNDAQKDAWYAPYAAYAKEHNLIDARNNMLHPASGMSRAEVAELMYRVLAK